MALQCWADRPRLPRAPLQVQRDYEELPAGAAVSLRDSLLSLLVKHCQVGGLAWRAWEALESR